MSQPTDDQILTPYLCHWCGEFGAWGFARTANGRSMERRRACVEHKEAAEEWHKEVNGG